MVVFFGTVVEERTGRARTSLQNDDRYKEKVILKKVSQAARQARLRDCCDDE